MCEIERNGLETAVLKHYSCIFSCIWFLGSKNILQVDKGKKKYNVSFNGNVQLDVI